MKQVHNIIITVFAKEYEDSANIKKALCALVPLDFEKEKISINIQNAEGFDSKILIMCIQLFKPAHTNIVIDFLRERLSPEQKQILLEQTESRVDEELIVIHLNSRMCA